MATKKNLLFSMHLFTLLLAIVLSGCKASNKEVLIDSSNILSNETKFYARKIPLSHPSMKNFRDFMSKRSLTQTDCPVGFSKLVLIEMPHHDLQGKIQVGQLVVHEEVTEEVEQIFRKLYQDEFQIEKMRIVSIYGADDDKSMEANNTSAFNCRKKTGGSSFSVHSYGKAIDINPRYNPYIKGEKILPQNAKEYVDRENLEGKHFILNNSAIVTLFTEQGWRWGGHYRTLKDYHHFEKLD